MMALRKDELSSSPSSPTSELQDHLYQSFLLGRAADVTLDVISFPRWSAQYRLHRVILTQAVRYHLLVVLTLIAFIYRVSFAHSSLQVSWNSLSLLILWPLDYLILTSPDLVSPVLFFYLIRILTFASRVPTTAFE
jgi:hypothetical protein